jgi:hypothetical protein
MVVLVILAELIGGCFGVDPGHDGRRDDRHVEPTKTVLIILEDEQQFFGRNCLCLDVREQLVFFEVVEVDPSFEPEVDLVVARKKQLTLVFLHLEEEIDILGGFEFGLGTVCLVSIKKFLYFGEVSGLWRSLDVGHQFLLQRMHIVFILLLDHQPLLLSFCFLFDEGCALCIELVDEPPDIFRLVHHSGLDEKLQFLIVAFVVHHTLDATVFELVLGLEVVVVLVVPVFRQEIFEIASFLAQHPFCFLLHKQLLLEPFLKVYLKLLVQQIRFAFVQKFEIVLLLADRLQQLRLYEVIDDRFEMLTRGVHTLLSLASSSLNRFFSLGFLLWMALVKVSVMGELSNTVRYSFIFFLIWCNWVRSLSLGSTLGPLLSRLRANQKLR